MEMGFRGLQGNKLKNSKYERVLGGSGLAVSFWGLAAIA
jgi:hypothetical protein